MTRDQSSSTMAACWTGRVDAEPGDARRWHQLIAPFDARSTGGATLIGFAVDEGVSRNGGRPGAADGPAALRAALANLPVLGEPALFDAGDIACDGNALEQAQAALGRQVARVLQQGSLPLVLGGGHEVAWGTFQGIAAAHASAPRLLILNLDAHFDLRLAEAGNSGTPFFQIHEWCEAKGWSFDYRVYGISAYANTRALFDRARAWGVRHWLDEQLQDPARLDLAAGELASALAGYDAVYLTVCLDVLPGEKAPGVSAPAALGVPLAHVETMIDVVRRSGKLRAADIAELNPSRDRDGLTARVAARLAARMAGHGDGSSA